MSESDAPAYVLDEQVGFVLRQVTQRHVTIFAAAMPADLTPTQFAALARLLERGPMPQTQLGRLTAMDAATIKGVIDRLRSRDLVQSARDQGDGRLIMISLTDTGHDLATRCVRVAESVTRDTLAPLSADEQVALLRLLERLR